MIFPDVAMQCPKCHERSYIAFNDYMKGHRPLCDFCGKTRMVKAPEEPEKNDG